MFENEPPNDIVKSCQNLSKTGHVESMKESHRKKKFLKKHLEIKTSFKKSQFSVLGQNVTGNKVLSLHNWDLFSKKLTGIKALKKIYTKKNTKKSTKSCKNEVKTETYS